MGKGESNEPTVTAAAPAAAEVALEKNNIVKSIVTSERVKIVAANEKVVAITQKAALYGANVLPYIPYGAQVAAKVQELVTVENVDSVIDRAMAVPIVSKVVRRVSAVSNDLGNRAVDAVLPAVDYCLPAPAAGATDEEPLNATAAIVPSNIAAVRALDLTLQVAFRLQAKIAPVAESVKESVSKNVLVVFVTKQGEVVVKEMQKFGDAVKETRAGFPATVGEDATVLDRFAQSLKQLLPTAAAVFIITARNIETFKNQTFHVFQARLKTAYDALDEDKDGSVTLSELSAAIAAGVQNVSQDAWAGAQGVVTNATDTVTSARAALSQAAAAAYTSLVLEHKAADTDGDGKVSFAEFAAHTKKRMGDAYTANMEPALREAYKVAEAQRERILAEVTGKIALAKSASDRALAYAGLGEKQAEEAAEKKDN